MHLIGEVVSPKSDFVTLTLADTLGGAVSVIVVVPPSLPLSSRYN